jgi:hypothetical protein
MLKGNESRDKEFAPCQDTSLSTSKTVLKKRVSTPQGRVCVNHIEMDAEFRITIDGDILSYCGKCAAHLASNGFQVERIGQSRSPIRVK